MTEYDTKSDKKVTRHVLTHDNFKKMPVVWDLYGAVMHPFLNTFQQKTKKSVGKIFFNSNFKVFYKKYEKIIFAILTCLFLLLIVSKRLTVEQWDHNHWKELEKSFSDLM